MPSPADTVNYSTTPENTTASAAAVNVTATTEPFPVTVTALTTGATQQPAPLRHTTFPATTSLSPSFSPQSKASVGLKTCASLT